MWRMVSGLALSFAALGCGGQTDVDGGTGGGGIPATGGAPSTGGAGGGGGANTGGGAGSGGLAQECSVSAAEPPPYPTEFEFFNPSSMPLWVSAWCELDWQLYTCADGFGQAIPHEGACTVDCAGPPDDCMACDQCPSTQELVLPGGSIKATWNGMTYAFKPLNNGCECHVATPAQAGKYAVKVSVYSNIAEAPWDAWGYFDLPAFSTVKVPLVSLK